MVRISVSVTKNGGRPEDRLRPQTLIHNVREILKKKRNDGQEAEMSPLLQEFCLLVDDNHRYAAWKVDMYKWMGLVLLTLIPIMSAGVSVLVSLKGPGWLPGVIIGLSCALTLFTVVNSLYKPSARFHDACIVNMGIDRFKSDFLIALSQSQGTDQEIARLVDQKQRAFDRYQHDLIGLLMPQQAAAQPESPSGDQHGAGQGDSGGPHPPGSTSAEVEVRPAGPSAMATAPQSSGSGPSASPASAPETETGS